LIFDKYILFNKACLASSRISGIFGAFRPAVFVHILVLANSSDTREFHSPFTHNLAERIGGINLLADFRNRRVGVKEVQLVKILGSEFDGIDIKSIEKASSLVHSDDERTADIADTIRVLPTILFSNGIKIRDGQVSIVGFKSNFRNREVLGAKSHVQSFSVDGSGGRRNDLFNDSHDRCQEFGRKERRVVVVSGIKPSPEEVVITIRNAFNSLEEFDSSIIVEFLGDFGFQRKPSDLETSISSPFNPILVGVHLDTSSGPVPTRLGFSNVEFSIDTESHGTVTDVTSTAVADNGVKTIESDNGQEITRLNEGFIKFNNNILGSNLPSVVHGFLEEFDVLSFHERSGLASEERNVGVKTQTTNEEPERLEEIRDEMDTLVADSEQRDTKGFEFLHLIISELEVNLVSTASGKDINVEVGQSGVEIRVGTSEGLGALESVDDLNSVLVDLLKGDGSFLETLSAISDSRVFEGQGASKDGSHLEEIRFFIIIAGHEGITS